MGTKLSERYLTDPAPLPLGGDELIEVTIPGSAPYTAVTTTAAVADLVPAQTITLTGDVTGSGTGTFAATIANDAVTYAKLQNVSATDKVLGRSTAGAGNAEEIACTAAGRALIDDADAAAQRTTLGLGTLATQSGTFSGTSSGTNTGDQSSVPGNAGSATVLATPRAINGVNFDGSAAITVSRVFVGTLTRTLSASSGNVAYTGVGFTPTSIEFHAAVDTTNEFCIGYAGASSRCMSTDSAGAKLSSSDCIRIIRASAGNEQKAVVASFDADGFTLAWTLVGAPPGNTLVVNFIARR